VAASTAYSVHGLRMLPFYIFYSMFGFQRVGDLIWAAADQRARGFLIVRRRGEPRSAVRACSTRMAPATWSPPRFPLPRLRSGFAGELAVILDHGARSMMQRSDDEFYYVTVATRTRATLAARRRGGAVIRGMRHYSSVAAEGAERAIASVRCSVRAPSCAKSSPRQRCWPNSFMCQRDLERHEFSELAREAAEVARWNRLHPRERPRESHLEQCLPRLTHHCGQRLCARLSAIDRPYLGAGLTVLGHGWLRSQRYAIGNCGASSRSIAAHCRCGAARAARRGDVDRVSVASAIERFGIETELAAPWTR